MKQDKLNFKSFRRISKGKENEGYLEWKSEVENMLKDINEHNLINMEKRVYFLLEECIRWKDAPKVFDLANCLLVFAVTAIIGVLTIVLDKVTLEKVMSFGPVFIFILYGFIVYMGCLAMREIRRYKNNIDKELYYDELLKIIQNVIAERKKANE